MREGGGGGGAGGDRQTEKTDRQIFRQADRQAHRPT